MKREMMRVFGGREQYLTAERYEVEEQIAVWEADMLARKVENDEIKEQTTKK